MGRSEESAAIVRETLDLISDQFGPVGGLTKLSNQISDQMCDVYVFEHNPIGGSGKGKEAGFHGYGEAIVVPRVHKMKKASLETARKAAAAVFTEGMPVHTTLLNVLNPEVDRDAAGAKRLSVMDTDEFWDRLTGVGAYHRGLRRRDSEFNQTEQEFVARGLASLAGERTRFFGSDSSDALQTLHRWVAIPETQENTGLIITGERGSGKSWLLKRLWDEVLALHEKDPSHRPAIAYVPLKLYSSYLRERQGLRRSIAHYLYEKEYFQPPAGVWMLEALITAGRVVLLLDGLDELIRQGSVELFEDYVGTLLDSLPPVARVIMTTRSTRFSSLGRLGSRLSDAASAAGDDGVHDEPQLVPNAEAQRYRPKFDIIALAPFESKDTNALYGRCAQREPDAPDLPVEQMLAEALGVDLEQNVIARNILDLCHIPACSRLLVDYLQRESPADNEVQLFESLVFVPLIAFNTETGRAVLHIRIPDRASAKVVTIPIDLRSRVRVLERIAGFLLEQGESRFQPPVLSSVLGEVFGHSTEIVGDLRTQTVFVFSDESSDGSLEFRSPSMRDYFVARHIYVLLADDSTVDEGVKLLGRYRLKDTGALEFLRAFFRYEVVDFQAERFDFAGISEHERLPVISDIASAVKKLLFRSEPFSAWTRFLVENLRQLEIELQVPPAFQEWSLSGLDGPAEGEVLVAGSAAAGAHQNQGSDALFISVHEVTNEEFKAFLESDIVPELLGEPEKRVVGFVFRKQSGNPRAAHPLAWQSIHPQAAGDAKNGCAPEGSPEFSLFTNSYHLFAWLGGEFPEQKAYHPVVWASMFVAAVYCNWQTHRRWRHEPMEAIRKRCAYEIGLRSGEPYIRRRHDAEGYRLPTAKEWIFASRGGDTGHTPWQRLVDSPDAQMKGEGERFRQSLLRREPATRDVREAKANGYGISGMIGNVREWAEKAGARSEGLGQIVGATWVLGERSFEYDFEGSALPMQNTNLDVGFRVARSVPLSLRKAIEKCRADREQSAVAR